uniref:Uncharacterized protein n=1 Tax=Arundo donax TaxID=35708 RepID=A0A0A9A1U3_ARUDO
MGSLHASRHLSSPAVVVHAHARQAPSKRNARLVDKEPAGFVDMTSRAVHLKTLRNTIGNCSKELKDHVRKRKLWTKKGPLAGLDLRKFGKVAGLCRDATRCLAVASPIHP